MSQKMFAWLTVTGALVLRLGVRLPHPSSWYRVGASTLSPVLVSLSYWTVSEWSMLAVCSSGGKTAFVARELQDSRVCFYHSV